MISNYNNKNLDITSVENIMDIQNMYLQSEKTKNDMIERALDSSICMVPLSKFKEVINFELEEIIPTEIMWNSFKKNIPIYITDDLIKVFGYKGDLGMQKRHVLDQLKKYKIHLFTYDNNEYENFCLLNLANRNELKNIVDMFPEVDRSNGKGKTKHYLIMPRDLKKLMLVVRTDNGDLIREYMVRLEELFQLYMEYQTMYEQKLNEQLSKHNNELINKVDKLLEDNKVLLNDNKELLDGNKHLLDDSKYMRQELDLANENLAELIRGVNETNISVIGSQKILGKIADNTVPRKHIHKKDIETYAIYYVGDFTYVQCRARPCHLTKRCKELKSKYAEFREVITLKPVPNARTLASEFDRRMIGKGVEFNQKNQSFRFSPELNFSEKDMIALAKQIFEERYDDVHEAIVNYPLTKINIENRKFKTKSPDNDDMKNLYEVIVDNKEENDDDDRFTTLVQRKTSELKEIARSFSRSKKHGGWSGKNKTDLAKWIIKRQDEN